jgi:hypothetical protein
MVKDGLRLAGASSTGCSQAPSEIANITKAKKVVTIQSNAGLMS